MKESELEALVSLLSDPDPEIFEHVRKKIFSLGPSVLEKLERFWEMTDDPELHQRIEGLIKEIHLDHIGQQLTEWAENPNNNLINGLLICARYQFPGLDEEKVRRYLHHIQKDAWLEVNSSLTAMEVVKTLNKIIFEIHGFHPNTSDYGSWRNNMINEVLETKKGNSLLLGSIYLIVAQSLDLPIQGVNLPEHFVLAYLDNSSLSRLFGSSFHPRILFYINPYNKGGIFSRREIEAFLTRLQLPRKDEYFYPCDNTTVVERLLNNLSLYFQNSGQRIKYEEVRRLKEALKKGKEKN
ncbi:MAG: transglutaminase-like domain-containing protein [Flavobacteriales bacterium]|nr:transglutaminase-like domain-containing protein [Flavobacteriales bacterium]